MDEDIHGLGVISLPCLEYVGLGFATPPLCGCLFVGLSIEGVPHLFSPVLVSECRSCPCHDYFRCHLLRIHIDPAVYLVYFVAVEDSNASDVQETSKKMRLGGNNLSCGN